MTEPKRLTRDVQNGMIGGVCAGLAEYFGHDPTLVRVAYVILSVLPVFAGVLVYILLWIIVPAKPPAPPASPPAPVEPR